MNTYLFNRDEFQRLYRCDYISSEEWSKYAKPNIGFGVAFIVLGAAYLTTYIPCLIVIKHKSTYRHSCYKIMFFMGLLDVVCLLINCFLTGIFQLTGSVYCQAPDFQYIAGSFATGGWSGQCMFCVLLAFNRCVDFWSSYWSDVLFKGRRTYIWICIPLLYMLFYVFFTPSATYTSAAIMWFFDPYVGVPTDVVPVDHTVYISWGHSINDYLVISCLVLLYSSLVISIRVQAQSRSHGKTQFKIILQAGIICLLVFVPALIFTITQFFQPPPVFILICVLCYQLGNGGTGLVLLTLNRTIRNNVMLLIFGRRGTVFSISSKSRVAAARVHSVSSRGV
ncbi:hypothetical protein QR680_016270 [Steinernema hermaphroditum]|uniref:Uncharacterized protein n=1 Tax=Steinernema hermaphroditum TaxID=289476 RepID=A0AA39LM61_9BILA|nr:hypothetical protein QR680_016270 [Steinernema hermaphroditum]